MFRKKGLAEIRKKAIRALAESQENESSGIQTTKYIFSKIKGFVETAGEVISETLSTSPTINDYWYEILAFYNSDVYDFGVVNVNNTRIPQCLEGIYNLLLNEWSVNQQKDSSFGKLTNFLFREKVLYNITLYAELDFPTGILPLVLRFFKGFVDAAPSQILVEPAFKNQLYKLIKNTAAFLEDFKKLSEFANTLAYEPNPDESYNTGTVSATILERFMMNGFPSLSLAYKIWRTHTTNGPFLINNTTIISRFELVRLLNSIFCRLALDIDLCPIYFSENYPAKQYEPESKTKSFDRPNSTESTRTLFYNNPEEFYLWILFSNLMIPGLTGEVSREALLNYSLLCLRCGNHTNFGNFFSSQKGIITGLIENTSYLYSQMSITKPALRSKSCRIFSLAMMGPRALPIPVRQIYDYEMKSQQNRKYSSVTKSKSESVDDSLVLPFSKMNVRNTEQQYRGNTNSSNTRTLIDQGSFSNPDYLESVLTSFKKRQKDVDMFFLCWELLDEITVSTEQLTIIRESVYSRINSSFLRPTVFPSLASVRDSLAFTTTIYVTELIKCTHSQTMKRVLYEFLLGCDTFPESKNPPRITPTPNNNIGYTESFFLNMLDQKSKYLQPDFQNGPGGTNNNVGLFGSLDNGTTGNGIRLLLVDRMLDENDKLSLSTLKLFDTLLDTFDQFVYTSLVLRNFIPRKRDVNNVVGLDNETGVSYFTEQSAIGMDDSLGLDYNLARSVMKHFMHVSPSKISLYMPEAVKKAAQSTKNKHAQNFLKSDPNQTEPGLQTDNDSKIENDPDYDLLVEDMCCTYTESSIIKLNLICQVKQKIWKEIDPTNLQPNNNAEFFCGDFIGTLFKLLKSMLSHHATQNLVLTSILSKLILIGDHNLCTFLLFQNNSMANILDYQTEPFDVENITMPQSPKSVESGRCSDLGSQFSGSERYLHDLLVIISSKAHIKSRSIVNFEQKLEQVLNSGLVKSVYYAKHLPEKDSSLDQTKIKDFGTEDLDPSLNETSNKNKGSNKRFLLAYAILEEFCKEIGGITMAHAYVALDQKSKAIQIKQNTDLETQ
ncbi:hypothetical protein BB558_000616 [Smittium angustum]|uniref:FHF complex subunit HOOK-interacting protein C-terminal domain-containing protein n=1 Tax=Smittium angustum TaxID=133377 RepID=A0A2U1JDY2_SMIAN|nr:hypothetical protein BB558_000616 [Smittium angustum]